MEAAAQAIQPTTVRKTEAGFPLKKPVGKGRRKIDTLEKFRAWTPPEDGFKYEWNNGIIETSPKMITFENFFIVERLTDFFYSLKAGIPAGGLLFTEPESMTSATQLRIPDMAYYTAQQIADAAAGKTPSVPEFIIEFVSDNDVHQKVLKKLDEYFNAGARVVWLIVPQVKLVYVYTSPIDVYICKGERLCSAEPVVPGFKTSADALFS